MAKMRGMELPESGHDPVLMNEVLEGLAPGEGKTIVDCTLGRAGHALEIAKRLGKTGRLVGFVTYKSGVIVISLDLPGRP